MSSIHVPTAPEAERAALGAVFVRGSAFAEIAAVLRAEDFHLPANRQVFEAMAALDAQRVPLDLVTVSEELRARGSLPRLEGGEAYLVQLAQSTTVAENVGHHARVVREASAKRRLIALCADVQAKARGSEATAGDLMQLVADEVAALVTGSSDDLLPSGRLVHELLDEFDRRAQERGVRKASEVTGIPFGVAKLDEYTTGLQPRQLVVVAAETSGGKTVLAMQAAVNCCLERGGTSLVFNLEMGERELLERVFAHRAEINSHTLRTGDWATAQGEPGKRLTNVARALNDSRLYIVDDVSTLAGIRSKALRWRARHPMGPAMVVIDFLQLVGTKIEKGETRANAVGRIAKSLKDLAKELKVPVVLVSQLNRSSLKQNLPPTKYDLKESGDIENAADVIVLIWNEEGTSDGDVELLLEKNRNGARGRLRASFVGRHYRFGEPKAVPDPVPHWQDGNDG